MTAVDNLHLRRAQVNDLEIIARLEQACFGTQDGAFSRRQLRALLDNPRAYWLLAANDMAMACWLQGNNGRARWARLYSLAVHPSQRGLGLGAGLLAAGFAWMRENNLSVCRAEVKAVNTAARGLYASQGFQECGLLKDYYALGIHGVRLVKQLSELAKPTPSNKAPNLSCVNGRPLQARHSLPPVAPG